MPAPAYLHIDPVNQTLPISLASFYFVFVCAPDTWQSVRDSDQYSEVWHGQYRKFGPRLRKGPDFLFVVRSFVMKVDNAI